MHTLDVGATWAGTHVFRAHRIHHPASTEEVSRLVRASDRIRALGTRHSFNGLADSAELLTLVDLDPGFQLDESARQVSVAAGTRYGVLATWLEKHGYALPNMGSLPHISVGGATATATHGSGDGNGVLATAVSGVELVAADGSILMLNRTDDEFAGVVPSLGALGVITRVTLDIEPSYRVRQDLYRELDWAVTLAELDNVMASGYSVSLFTTWAEPTIARALVKTRLDPHRDDRVVPHEFYGAAAMGDDDPRIADLGNNRTQLGGVPGPWCDRLPHFRLDAVPSSGSEIQSEYFVDRRDGVAALRAVHELAGAIAPHLITSEIRSIAADTLWLSMAYARPSLAIHFTWRNHPESVARLLPRIEASLAPYAPRPHWGKAFTMTATDIRPLYPRIDDFVALHARMDPTGKFSNDYLNRTLEI